MIRKILTLSLAMAAIMHMGAKDTKGIEIAKINGECLDLSNSEIRSMSFDGDLVVITSASDQQIAIPRDQISSISNIASVSTAYTITYDGASARVVNPYALQGVSTEIDGAYVTTTNDNTTDELTFALSGSTSDGAYTYNGSFKCTLQLDGVTIASQRGAAIDVKCGKRIAVVLSEGTVNTLSDYAEGDQKAALYFKGHPEFAKGGTLNVTGNANHAISSKEYLQIKKTVGTINILGAANDGIHAGQYFQMNGGILNIDNINGDGIQAEPTDDATDEDNGQVIIKGGEITVTAYGPTADCIKADSLITISGGTLTLKATGNGVQDPNNAPAYGPGGGGGGWPGGGGGWPGGGGGSKVETSSPKCINGGWDIVISGGTITTLSTGKGGKGIVCDGNLTIGGDGMEPNISCTTTGTAVAGSGENLSGQPKAIKAEGDICINSGSVFAKTTQSGGEGIESKSTITINGGAVVCNTYDDGINAAKKITLNGGVIWSWAQRNDGMDCNGSQGLEINGGVIVSQGAASPEEGFDCDNYSFVINGGTAFGIGGATSNVTKATQPYASTTGIAISQNKYISMCDASGNVIMSYLCPASLSSATVVSTSPSYGNNTSCKLVYGVTAVNNPTESYLDGRILIGGTITGGTSKNITPKTK